MSKRDIESYSVNELGMMAIKQLKRIADAIEAQTAAVMSCKPTSGPDVSKEPVKIDLSALRSEEKAPQLNEFHIKGFPEQGEPVDEAITSLQDKEKKKSADFAERMKAAKAKKASEKNG